MGHQIYIYNCRSNPEIMHDDNASENEMIDYLQKHNIKYHGILKNKPYFDYVIDDRNYGIPLDSTRSVDWNKFK